MGKGSTHDYVAEDIAAKRAAEDPEVGQRLGRLQEHLRMTKGDHLQNAIGQPWRAAWTLGQTWSYARVYHLLRTGSVVRVRVNVGTVPRQDRFRAENGAALSDLPEPFVASVCQEQNGGDCDGDFAWAGPIQLSQGWDGGIADMPAFDQVSLEIGSTSASRTLLHLVETGCVARWPYGSEDIWLFVGFPNPFAFQARLRGLSREESA